MVDAQRNDPCPCGSGLKYKKCCLPKDLAARSQRMDEARRVEPPEPELPAQNQVDAPGFEVPIDAALSASAPAIDPLIQRGDDFLEALFAASYADKWDLFSNTLATEPEILDAHIVFEATNELLSPAIEAGEWRRFAQLLDQIEVAAPQAFQEELGFMLEWRSQIALIEGDDVAAASWFAQLASVADTVPDHFHRVAKELAYHGKLDALYEGMRRAQPVFAESEKLEEWVQSEFAAEMGDVEVAYMLRENPNLLPDDPTLLRHFEQYELSLDPEQFAKALEYRTGRRMPDWTVADFERARGEVDLAARQKLACLTNAFAHYAQHERGMPITKVELAHVELRRYLISRQDDKVRNPARHRKKAKPGISRHPLCPDSRSLDRHLGELYGFFSAEYVRAAALFEVIPVWLQFLVNQGLLDEEARPKVLQELSYLKGTMLQLVDSMPTGALYREYLADWPYEERA